MGAPCAESRNSTVCLIVPPSMTASFTELVLTVIFLYFRVGALAQLASKWMGNRDPVAAGFIYVHF
ncbi:hypothetical protein OKW43_005912 [Paraburkholderia sp. WC7.3g]